MINRMKYFKEGCTVKIMFFSVLEKYIEKNCIL